MPDVKEMGKNRGGKNRGLDAWRSLPWSPPAQNRLFHAFQIAAETCRLMVGAPDYDRYVAHRKNRHPDQPLMTHQEFFNNRQERRYGGGVNRCC